MMDVTLQSKTSTMFIHKVQEFILGFTGTTEFEVTMNL